MNVTLEQHTQLSLDELERNFEEYARALAAALAPETDFDRENLPRPGTMTSDAIAAWLEQHPKNFWGTLQLASSLVRERKFADAIAPLERAIELYPGYTGPESPYSMLASVYRELNKPEEERRILSKLLELDCDAVQASIRLLELDAAVADWAALQKHALVLMGTNPLLVHPHRALAQAAEKLDNRSEAIQAYEKMLLLEPEDPAEIHYRLGKLLHEAGDPRAKRHVLMALEEAPRFPAALRLLLTLQRAEPNEKPSHAP
jgi:tetratricopeptide (TPR) repeat protein